MEIQLLFAQKVQHKFCLSVKSRKKVKQLKMREIQVNSDINRYERHFITNRYSSIKYITSTLTKIQSHLCQYFVQLLNIHDYLMITSFYLYNCYLFRISYGTSKLTKNFIIGIIAHVFQSLKIQKFIKEVNFNSNQQKKTTMQQTIHFYQQALQIKWNNLNIDNIIIMEKQLYKFIDQYCKSQQQSQSLRKEVLQLVQSRADMPKHFFIHIHKIFLNKSQYSMINVLDLIEYMLMNSELPFYSQLATKELCFKFSNLIVSKQTPKKTKNRCLELVSSMEQTLRPHSDLLPHAFQFIQNLQAKGEIIPREYRSIYCKKASITNNQTVQKNMNEKQLEPMKENLLDIQNIKKEQEKVVVNLLDLQNTNLEKNEKPSQGIFDLLDMNSPSQVNPNDFMTEYDMNQQDNNNKFMNLI